MPPKIEKPKRKEKVKSALKDKPIKKVSKKAAAMVERPDFESCIDIINREIAKRRSKWKLTSIAWMDFADIEQKIRMHLFKKWDKWNPEMPLLPWLNTVITNQIINIVRSNYSNYARPCLTCPHNAGGIHCNLYSVQSDDCAEYLKWSRTKKHAYDVKLPISISDHRIFGEGNEFDARASSSSGFDFESFIPKFHQSMMDILPAPQKKIYNLLFIEHIPEDKVILMLGYKNGSTKTGYKLVKKLRSLIVEKAREILPEMLHSDNHNK